MNKTAVGTEIPAVVVRRAKSGDADAMDQLLRHLYPLVSRWTLVRMGNADDAQDVTQEVMIRVNKHIKRFDHRSKLTTWAYQVTSNAVVDHHRRTRRREATTETGDIDPTPNIVASASISPADGIDAAEAAGLVRIFFAELPEKQREVFDLADLQGYRSSEVADMLQMNPATVRGHLFRARRFIRKKILQSNPKLVEAYGREL